MSADRAALTAQGERVWVGPVRPQDVGPYRIAVEASRIRLSEWNPVNADDINSHLRGQSPTHRTLMIRARQVEGDHDIVGRVNVSNIQRGRSHSAALGYDAYDPYVGRGLFAEGLRLIVDLAFAAEPMGLGLHRVEASVQPGNTRSAGMLRSLGFRPRGRWPSYLWIPNAYGVDAWRDHITYGLTSEEWPAEPFQPPTDPRPVAFLPQSVTESVAGAVARELAVPVFSVSSVVGAGGVGLLALLLNNAHGGAVVLGDLPIEEALLVVEAAALDPERVLMWEGEIPDQRRHIVAVALAAQAAAAGQLPG